MEERKSRIHAALRKHTEELGSDVSQVFVVCHWGVMYTLTGTPGAENLECVHLDGIR